MDDAFAFKIVQHKVLGTATVQMAKVPAVQRQPTVKRLMSQLASPSCIPRQNCDARDLRKIPVMRHKGGSTRVQGGGQLDRVWQP